MYEQDCIRKCYKEDRCQLYVFRMAVYYAEHTSWDEEDELAALQKALDEGIDRSDIIYARCFGNEWKTVEDLRGIRYRKRYTQYYYTIFSDVL